MLKFLGMLVVGIVTSFYFFPIEFTFLPGVNTKMALAGFSLLLLGIQLAQGKRASLDKYMFRLSAIAAVVSFIALIAITYNETPINTNATNIVTMWGWMGGAYVVANLIRALYGKLTIELVCNFLIGVCVAQCIFALLIDNQPAFKNIVNTYVSGFGFVDMNMLNDIERLYGIGAALDVAGLRFSTVLVAIAYLSSRIDSNRKKKKMVLYLLAFVFIALVGNMMSRTTSIGIGLALFYWCIRWFAKTPEAKANNRCLWLWLTVILLVCVPLIVWQYQIDGNIRQNIRFAFEGFFSLAEEGTWNVHSNNILKNMVVFPDNLKTWLIGDGYFDNPFGTDPYYTGPNFGGFYKNTDIGYLRFVFYFGVIGLLAFIYFFQDSTRICIQKFPMYRCFFLFILSVNLIGWFKVSSDIFPIYALFMVPLYSNDVTKNIDRR